MIIHAHACLAVRLAVGAAAATAAAGTPGVAKAAVALHDGTERLTTSVPVCSKSLSSSIDASEAEQAQVRRHALPPWQGLYCNCIDGGGRRVGGNFRTIAGGHGNDASVVRSTPLPRKVRSRIQTEETGQSRVKTCSLI